MTIRRTLLNALAILGGRSVTLEELTLTCSDGTVLAGQRFGKHENESANTILCIHGWMDNCRSFHHLAPALASNTKCQVVALDLPGHGRSSHKSNDAPPMVQAELSYYVSEAIDALGLSENPLTLCGHSLGAGISSLYAAAFPERVSKLVLLDGAGFLAREAKDTALHVRRHVESRKKYQSQCSSASTSSRTSSRIYPSLERAIQTRRLSASRMPGKQSISHEAARELVERGTVTIPEGIQFRHDPRFAWPSIQYMTWAQSEGIFQHVQADVCLLVAEHGYPFKTHHMERTKELLRPRLFDTLPGSHYFHADPDTAGAVAESISRFLRETED